MAEPSTQIEAEIDALLLLQGRSGLEDDATPWSLDGPSTFAVAPDGTAEA